MNVFPYILSLTLLASSAQASVRTLIERGKPVEMETIGKSWTHDVGFLAGGPGKGEFLWSKASLGDGDFAFSAKLRIDELKHTAASIELGGARLVLDARGGAMLFEGSVKSDPVPLNGVIRDGEDFVVQVSRAGKRWAVDIDGKRMLECDGHSGYVGRIGFRPWRATIGVVEAAVKGSFVEAPKLDYAFASGDDGYACFRIPSLIKTKQGTLLAFAEGRVNGAGDAGNIDLVMKRSTDGGRSWSALHVIRDIDQTAGNPCPVVDRAAGRIVMVFCEMDHHEHHIMQGKSKRRVFTCYSDDDGVIWSEPVNITAMVNPDGVYDWLASGPGVGIQLAGGAHAGRLVIPFANSVGHAYGVHTIYSDDKGKTWQASERIEGGCNESQLVELSDGRLMLNMRMQRHSKGCRGISYSSDGSATWSELVHDDELNCPTCQASLISYTTGGRRDLLFSNPATGGRNGMTLRLSADEGQTWPVRKLLYPLSSAYSCLAVSDYREVICLFEGGPEAYSKSGIAVVRLPLSALVQSHRSNR